jgi:uncharacterized protein YukE
MKFVKYTSITLLAIVFLMIFAVVSKGCSWLGKAADVAEQQVDPARLLKTYEWFKDASAQADKKLADIKVYENRLSSMNKSYEGTSRRDWDRTDKEQFNQWESEISGVIASYNQIAAEYNAAMSKINYRFTNVGDLPKGATEPLSREIREYKTDF